MQIEIGKTYRAKNGNIVKITGHGGINHLFMGDDGNAFTGGGYIAGPKNHTNYDLIEEVIVPSPAPYSVPRIEMPGTDPKAAHGENKPQLHLNPAAGSVEQAKAHALGARKHGPWNWRKSRIHASTYIGAIKRHVDEWFEGRDVDPESGASDLGAVMANCAIILDSIKHGTLVDDRPSMTPKH